MPTFEERLQSHLDARTDTLGKIKARSVDADMLTLTALNVLVYAQLEGGIKDLASCVLRDINYRRPPLGDIRPAIIRWRNPDEIERFKSTISFEMIANHEPFANLLQRRFTLRGINRKSELNQMGWDAIKRVYIGLGLDYSSIQKSRTRIDEIVIDRNQAAHHGILPQTALDIMAQHLRENADAVESILFDFCLQLIPFFTSGLHLR